MEQTRGFITVATGREEYYQLAHNLLRSYHCFCPEPLPFAVLCDRENRWTADFDDVVIFPDGATNTYLDKLQLGELLPYDVNIFIDSDCLAFGNLNELFDYFEKADDFSCFGRVLPLDDRSGWFEYQDLGELQSKVSYVVGLHGGIYFLRRTEKSSQVLRTARNLVPDYEKYRFKGKFANPGDEPLVALAMALHNCHPIPFGYEAICCYWEYIGRIQVDISRSRAYVTRGLGKPDEPQRYPVTLLHWGTRYTRESEYQLQAALLDLIEQADPKAAAIRRCKQKFRRKMRAEKHAALCARIKRKLRRVFKTE